MSNIILINYYNNKNTKISFWCNDRIILTDINNSFEWIAISRTLSSFNSVLKKFKIVLLRDGTIGIEIITKIGN